MNLVEKIMLIKSVLSSLPLFQCASLLAPKLILQCTTSNIIETKKFHLIKWSIICIPKDQGELFIKYLALMNVAMGAKIV